MIVRVRKATIDDAAAIAACLTAAFEPYRDQYTPAGFADTVLDAEGVRRRLGEMTLFVAICEGTIAGTIGCSAHGHLRGMAVLPERQGSAAAAALLQVAEAELVKNGCAYATLDTTEPLRRAVRFYEKHGFSRSGRVSDFFGMPLYEYRKKL